jgi:aerobic-type carbon monoxide dehydrogenase small subunit (CoxS/CutS family)
MSAEFAKEIAVTVNGTRLTARVSPRKLLADFLREDLRLTGTHLGCEHGVCGACTVIVDGVSTRSCLMLAVQADGASVETVEALSATRTDTADAGAASQTGDLHPLQQAFWTHHALQCGFCTSGILMSLVELLRNTPSPSEEDVRLTLSGHLCRCTGYQNIVDAAMAAASMLRGSDK